MNLSIKDSIQMPSLMVSPFQFVQTEPMYDINNINTRDIQPTGGQITLTDENDYQHTTQAQPD
jgi:hypothetical protein